MRIAEAFGPYARVAAGVLGLFALALALPWVFARPSGRAASGVAVHQQKVAASAQPVAPRLQNLGRHTFPVATDSAQAQLFINQGLNLSYAFNHAGAGRAFAEAARLDPECAMAWWGQALVLGPNINAPMDPADEAKAHALVQRAVALKSHASAREQAYIDALAARYSGNAADRAKNGRAYADRMHVLHQRFPDDLDAATLYAEALMDLRPWDYWTRDGLPYAETEQAIDVIEIVLARDPYHPGALHFWIHLMEPVYPERAEQAADRLRGQMPDAGHIVHMPGHIYVRVGRYGDAVTVNQQAAAADERYIEACRVQGFYPVSYYPHNYHFLWYAATMQGRSALAIDAARKVAARATPEALAKYPGLQQFAVVSDYALVRFGHWDEILLLPPPASQGPVVVGIRHYARGAAFTAKSQLPQAEAELVALRNIAADPKVHSLMLWSPNSVGAVLDLAAEVLAGEIAAQRGDFAAAIANLDTAVRLEDGLNYIEPPEWHTPVRQILAAVLLRAGRAPEAETVYWEDLKRNPKNGWSLYGLQQAMEAQGKSEQAAAISKRFREAWAEADVNLDNLATPAVARASAAGK
jgi:tetratricopeptide (TPR) repeat protein